MKRLEWTRDDNDRLLAKLDDIEMLIGWWWTEDDEIQHAYYRIFEKGKQIKKSNVLHGKTAIRRTMTAARKKAVDILRERYLRLQSLLESYGEI